jgi:hypothetical protein
MALKKDQKKASQEAFFFLRLKFKRYRRSTENRAKSPQIFLLIANKAWTKIARVVGTAF